MFPKLTFILSLLALTAPLAHAAPPACLTSAVNTQSDPSNIRAICTGANATEIVDYICQHCGDDVKAALGDFEEGCLGSGMDISTVDACSPDSPNNGDDLTSSGAQTATHSSGHGNTATGTSTMSGSGVGDATTSASQSGGGNAEGTNAAAEVGAGNGGVSAALLFAALVAL